MYVYVCHTHLYNWSIPFCYSTTAAFNDVTVNQHLIEYWLTLIGLVSMTFINAKATSIHDNDYNCHVTAVKLVWPIVGGPYHTTSRHQPRKRVCTHTHTHAYRRPHRNNFKKSGWCAWFKIQVCVCPCSIKLNEFMITVMFWS